MTELDAAPNETADETLDQGHAEALCATASAHERRPLVMVAHASVGSGHKSAATSIAQAIELMRAEGHPLVPQDLEIEVVDILDWGRHRFDGDQAASYFVGATRPIYDLAWRYTFTGRVLWGGGTIWSHLMYAPFTRHLRARTPDLVVATHITAANSAIAARMLNRQRFPVVCVPTDYETEGLWPHLEGDLFCVATQYMAETLRARKVHDGRIQVTGIPTREEFRLPHDRTETRRRLGLPADETLVLCLAGAQLPTPYLRLRAALDEVIPQLNGMKGMHAVFVAGGDGAYEAHLNDMKQHHDVGNMTVFGYMNEMAALMSACDLVVCKPGGLTVTECLCSQTPMVLVGRAYGQEKINVEMLTAASAAMHVTTPRELIDALFYILENPHGLDGMLVNGGFIRKPHAARTIAESALRLAWSAADANEPPRPKRFAHFYIGHQPAHVR
ncbi:UDP-N-acetylglucosamine--LPS N-acetylglucosamine transferase [Berryella wangjianweii]|uniref:UDP-N-acetylglucosamine--LPS N-acetylglucosamine transferase n=1 Tax=Berryella wangjianweii TaxID=2734634 RepID=A0A6M8J8T0_9ACTN|nr:glycosyltransferase [Berryella wangjianweii]QKF07799.1 UDP-N-acetylglucosamine--LPS N-acetylglucosamine transferase [Berryella wangjianweii]